MASIKLFRGRFGHVSLLSAASDLVTHAHPEAHIIIWLEGDAGEMVVSGRKLSLGQDHAIGINSFEPHSHSFSRDCAPGLFLAFYIDPEWASRRRDLRAGEKLFPHPSFVLNTWLRDAAIALFNRFEGEFWNETLTAYEIERLIDQLFDAARPTAAHRGPRAGDASITDFRVRKAIEVMRGNVSGRMNFDDLARSVGLSRPHFFALFKEHMKLTPNVYWNTLRMEEALRQLETSDELLTSVACLLGFTTQSNFTRFFRDHAGVPPTLYRDAARLST